MMISSLMFLVNRFLHYFFFFSFRVSARGMLVRGSYSPSLDALAPAIAGNIFCGPPLHPLRRMRANEPPHDLQPRYKANEDSNRTVRSISALDSITYENECLLAQQDGMGEGST